MLKNQQLQERQFVSILHKTVELFIESRVNSISKLQRTFAKHFPQVFLAKSRRVLKEELSIDASFGK